jgi:hypothetical protein
MQLNPDEILESPYVLIGTVDEVIEDLQMRRERWGISYYVPVQLCAGDPDLLLWHSYKPIAAVVLADEAIQPGKPQLFENAPNNVCFDWSEPSVVMP